MDDGVGPLVMRVYLVRHGEAADAATDAERPLTAAGRVAVERLAIWCAAGEIRPDEIRHSGLLRAAQTAEILASRLTPAGGVAKVEGLRPNDDPRRMAEVLPHEDVSSMLVTHMPLVGDLAALLLRRRVPLSFATAEIAVLEQGGESFRLVETWRPGATAG